MLLVADALTHADGAWRLHPALRAWEDALFRCRPRWFACPDRTPLGWNAALHGVPPAAYRAAGFAHIPEGMRQLWVASPYAAQVGRDTVHVLPDAMCAWSEVNAAWLCRELAPMLAEEGMHLIHQGAAMLLCCRDPLDAAPADFVCISGGLLPDRHPPGRDGGRLMRLLAEIQMWLHAHPPNAGREMPVAGLWFWGACDWPCPMPDTMIAPEVATAPDAARRWPDAPPAGDLALAGSGRVAWVRHGRPTLPWRRAWRPARLRGEPELMAALQHAA